MAGLPLVLQQKGHLLYISSENGLQNVNNWRMKIFIIVSCAYFHSR